MKGILGMPELVLASLIFLAMVFIGVFWVAQNGVNEEINLNTDAQVKEYEAEMMLNALLKREKVRDALRSPQSLDEGDEPVTMMKKALKRNYREWRFTVSSGGAEAISLSSKKNFPGASASTYVASPQDQKVSLSVKVGFRR